jgi:hypothetical protein
MNDSGDIGCVVFILALKLSLSANRNSCARFGLIRLTYTAFQDWSLVFAFHVLMTGIGHM